ncbi:MAG: hypothetical protein RMX96_33995 [Nostoc sp. ChiSLP02]|nr:hypothetical protein [Nostoc sp. DedSLP05]MDZ8097185.1 hypothetical protein [Nostoc sp. DedSLP01]MDZ8189834.1 hypothetical protein [Nostoc sp. ChiSLP02]
MTFKSLWAGVFGLALLINGNIFAFGQEQPTQRLSVSFSDGVVSGTTNKAVNSIGNLLWHFYTSEEDTTYLTYNAISIGGHSCQRDFTKLLNIASYCLRIPPQVTQPVRVLDLQNHLAQLKLPRNGTPTGRTRGGATRAYWNSIPTAKN